MKQWNIKTPLVFHLGVLLLCVLIGTLNMVGGLYARYTAYATGTATANVAQIDFYMDDSGQFNYTFDDSHKFDADIGGVYAVIVEFEVINTGEVSYEYQLNLRLSDANMATDYDDATADAYITLSAPKNLSYVDLIEGNNLLSSKKPVVDITNSINMFNSGNAYYAFSSNGSDFTWSLTTVSNDGTAPLKKQALAIGEKNYYKLVYFIQMRPETSFKQMQFFYSAVCEQID